MTIDLSAIPAARLALLDTATLYSGAHTGGGPDCKHCARELLMEVVTGRHADVTPPGCTALMAVLPRLNDGPWRDDVHRTEVMRPYLRRMLLLDRANDWRRVYAIIDLIYRTTLPDIYDALKLDKHGSALRDLAPIVGRRAALAARLAARGALAAFDARAALDARAARAVRAARTVLDALDALAARAGLAGLAGLAALAGLAGLAALAALDACPESWERGVRQILDRICEVP